MSDRIAIMDDGRILQIGTPDEMYHRPKNQFVAGFIGNPPISFCPGAVQDNRFVTDGLDFDLPERVRNVAGAAGSKVTIGIRPENLQPDSATPVEGKISFVESQGREVLYDLTLSGGKILRSIQSGTQNYKLGDQVRWGFDANAVFFFDQDGNRI